MPGELAAKVAIVTGGASGIGRATVELFVKEGATVVIADVNADIGEDVAGALGDAAAFKRTDVSNADDVQAAVDFAVEHFGGLDVMFNNAGIGGAIGPLEFVAVEDWDRTQSVCLRGVFLGIKHAIAPMRAAGGGSIISTASIAGIDGYPGLHAYCAAKAGVVNLTRSASIDLACDMIRVNCIAPGGVSTPILYGGGGVFGGSKETADAMLVHAQPLPIAGQPEDIAQAALFLASDASRFITGHTLVVDGGATSGSIANAPRRGAERQRPQRAFAGPSFEA